jgi:hypothetical protein
VAIREGAWDCPSCGRKANRGPEKFCAGCGAPRGVDVAFYLPPEAAEVTDQAALARARAGPDWACSYCGGDNPGDHAFCTGCGAGRDGSPPRPVVDHRGVRPSPPQETGPRPVVEDGVALAPLPQEAGPWLAPERRRTGRRWLLGGCLGLVVLAALAFLLGRPRTATLTVAGFAWERTVEVERLGTEVEEAWEGEVPAGTRELSRSRQVHHEDRIQIGSERRTRTVRERVQTGTERVKVGVRDLGNGYFEDIYEDRPVYDTVERQEAFDEPVYRTEPVYRMRVRFEIDRWRPVRTERAGAEDHSPRWPPLSLAAGERQGKRGESYSVRFHDEDGDEVSYRPASEAEWAGLEAGRAYRAKVRGGKVHRLLGPA